METTPVTTSSRHRSRLAGRAASNKQSHPQTSTPAAAVTSESGRRRRAFDDEEDDDEYCLPNTQFQPKAGEVYWNFEASPTAKATLQRQLAEADAKSPNVAAAIAAAKKQKKKKSDEISPLPMRLKAGQNKKADQKIMESMQEMYYEMLKNEQAEAEENTPVERSSADHKADVAVKDATADTAKEDLFGDSEDDSFLIQCTQAAENGTVPADRARKFVAPLPKPIQKPSPTEDPFDGDDSFDQLVSQMDEKAAKTAIRPKSSFVQNLNDSSFKRFKSANDSPLMTARPTKSVIMTTTTSPNSSFLRASSTPDVTSPCSSLPGGRPRCTQHEIEQKKIEAMKRRQTQKKRIK